MSKKTAVRLFVEDPLESTNVAFNVSIHPLSTVTGDDEMLVKKLINPSEARLR